MKRAPKDEAVLDRKGIAAFLSITFIITYAVEGAVIASGGSLIAPGLGQYMVATAMWVPALATIVTVKLVTREGFAICNVRLGNWRPYVGVALIIPLCFLFLYALTWLLGFGTADWTLQYFQRLLVNAGAPVPEIPPPTLFWPIIYLVTLLVAPFINTLFAFGEELGWRGYLLPKLLPLGKVRAYLLLGIIWGFWHLPLVLSGFMYPGYPIIGMVLFTLLTIGFGVYLSELTLRYRSSILAGWGHGIFNSQRLGVWALLFPDANPLLGGFSGIFGIAVWFLLGWWESRRTAPVPRLGLVQPAE